VKWVRDSTTTLWINNSGFVDAKSTSTTVATLTGGGLASSRTLTPASAQIPSWRMTAAARNAAANGIAGAQSATNELQLWKLWLPIVLVLAALALCAYVLRSYRKLVKPAIPTHRKSSPKENFA
jgi:high-affinity iron transporter